MKTIRTILATLATVLLGFALVAWFSVRRNAAFIQRTIYQGFDQTFGELPAEVKNRLSHRANALNEIARLLALG